MLLIWGFKVRYKDGLVGTFHCPHEGADRQFVRKMARKWFTFFFIPVIPLDELGEFVECAGCKRGFDLQVLTNPTSAQLMDNLSNAMRQAVTSIVRADGRVDDDEKRVAVEVMQRFSDTPYAMQHLEHDLESLPQSGLVEHMTRCAGTLSSHGKESLLSACVAVAIADGHFDDEERLVIEQAGHALGMTRSHINGVLADVSAPRTNH